MKSQLKKTIILHPSIPKHKSKDSLGFAGGEFVALAGTGHAAAGCAPEIAHPAEQHTFSEAPHIPARTRKSHYTDSLT